MVSCAITKWLPINLHRHHFRAINAHKTMKPQFPILCVLGAFNLYVSISARLLFQSLLQAHCFQTADMPEYQRPEL